MSDIDSTNMAPTATESTVMDTPPLTPTDRQKFVEEHEEIETEAKSDRDLIPTGVITPIPDEELGDQQNAAEESALDAKKASSEEVVDLDFERPHLTQEDIQMEDTPQPQSEAETYQTEESILLEESPELSVPGGIPAEQIETTNMNATQPEVRIEAFQFEKSIISKSTRYIPIIPEHLRAKNDMQNTATTEIQPQTQELEMSNSTTTNGLSTEQEEPVILLPDLFVSFISEKPSFHPAYERVRKASEDYFLETMKWDAKAHKRHCRGDFTYFSAMFCTEADEDDFRMVTDWCNWVFPFDDQFDEDGPMRGNYDLAKAELDGIYSLMTDNPVPYNKDEKPLRYIMQQIWEHIVKKGPESCQMYFRDAMAKYFHGVLDQVITDYTYREVDDETFLKERRESIGVYPVLHLIAFWRGLDIPQYVLEDPAIQEIEHVVADIVVLQNEILSYQKEYYNGDDRNIVARFRKNGLSQQEAYNRVDAILRNCYRRWYIAHSEIPCWNEQVDWQVYQYLKGCKDLCIANLDWSYKTQRYFGKQNDEVRRTRRVNYLP